MRPPRRGCLATQKLHNNKVQQLCKVLTRSMSATPPLSIETPVPFTLDTQQTQHLHWVSSPGSALDMQSARTIPANPRCCQLLAATTKCAAHRVLACRSCRSRCRSPYGHAVIARVMQTQRNISSNCPLSQYCRSRLHTPSTQAAR